MIRWNAVAMVLRANNRASRDRRPPRHVRLGGEPVRGRLQPLLPRQGRTGRRRPDLLPGPCRAGHLRPRLPRRPPDREPARPFPPGGAAATGLQLVPASAADARLLGVPHGLDGPRPARRRLPGALQPLPAAPRHQGHVQQRVWAFLGDGETDEPESHGRLSLAAREGLDNLTFVVNCNLQRLDGPVRGNGKIIQELEGLFRGAGWNVIKVIWGRELDELLARDVDGVLVEQMNETLDGEFQKYSVATGALHPRALLRAGPAPARDRRAPVRRRHRPASAAAATTTARCMPRTTRRRSTSGAPTAILAKTVKGWTLGTGVEARNITHQAKKLTRAGAARLPRPARAADPRRQAQGRALLPPRAQTPPRSSTCSSGARRWADRCRGASWLSSRSEPPRDESTASSRRAARPRCRPRWPSRGCCATCCATRSSGARSCPSSPTRHAPSAWTRCSRRSASTRRSGQLYEPVDSNLVLSYREAKDGQVLEEGITEAGSTASLQAAGTAYATHGDADDPLLHLLLDVRLPAHRRRAVGLRRRCAGAASCWAPRPAARRSTARGCSTRTATRRCSPRSSPTSASTTPRSPTRRRHRPRGHRAHVRRRRGRLLLPDAVQRELPDAAEPEGVDEDIIGGLYRYRAAPEVGGRRGRRVQAACGSGSIMQQVTARAGAARRAFGVAAEV